MNWLELSVVIDAEAVESVAALFAEYGYNGGVAVEEAFISSPDGPEYTIDTTRPATVRSGKRDRLTPAPRTNEENSPQRHGGHGDTEGEDRFPPSSDKI